MPPAAQPRRQLRRGRVVESDESPASEVTPIETSSVERTEQDPSAQEQSPGDPKVSQPTQLEAANNNALRAANLAQPDIELRPTGPSQRQNSLKFQPKAYTRRSKEEREAAERAEAERRQQRQSGLGNEGATRGRGRGNTLLPSPRDERLTSGGASGHLGLVFREGRKSRRGGRGGRGSNAQNRTVQDGIRIGVAGTGANGQASNVKAEKDKDGDVIMGTARTKAGVIGEPGDTYSSGKSIAGKQGGGRPIKIKEEPQIPDQPWSEDDEVELAQGPRINIEEINLISDDERDIGGFGDGAGKDIERQRTPLQHLKSFKPIRLGRQEHRERAVGVNTDASSLTSAELRRRKQEGREAEGSLFLDANEAAPPTAKPKGRGKARDVEFVRDERKWKGVYQDDEESDADPKVKEEPQDVEPMVVDDIPATTDIPSCETVEPEATKVPEDVDMPEPGSLYDQAHDESAAEPNQPKPSRLRHRSHQPPKPSSGTEEDNAEYKRLVQDHKILTETLTQVNDRISGPNAQTVDRDGNVRMDVSDENLEKEELYLFQFPPSLPMLVDPNKQKFKAEPTADQTQPASAGQLEHDPPNAQPSKSKSSGQKARANSSSSKAQTDNPRSKKKVTPGRPNATSKATTTPSGPTEISESTLPFHPKIYTPISDLPPAGLIGTLRLHDSKRITANWGPLFFEIERGAEENIAQEAVVCDWTKTMVKSEDFGGGGGLGIEGAIKEEEAGKWKEETKYGGRAYGMGEIGGNGGRAAFVAVPAWDMFGV